MTTTQAICESMGFMYDESGWVFDKNDHVIGDWEFVKALQARLRQDGWRISIFDDEDGFTCHAEYPNYSSQDFKTIIVRGLPTEPAAIVALYCKVKGIEVGNDN